MSYTHGVPISVLLTEYFAGQPKGAQRDAALELDVTAATVSRWTRGEMPPEDFRAEQIGRLIDKPEDVVAAAIQVERLRHQRQRRGPSPSTAERLRQLEELVAQLVDTVERLGRPPDGD